MITEKNGGTVSAAIFSIFLCSLYAFLQHEGFAP
jgi:hypothetical protein